MLEIGLKPTLLKFSFPDFVSGKFLRMFLGAFWENEGEVLCERKTTKEDAKNKP